MRIKIMDRWPVMGNAFEHVVLFWLCIYLGAKLVLGGTEVEESVGKFIVFIILWIGPVLCTGVLLLLSGLAVGFDRYAELMRTVIRAMQVERNMFYDFSASVRIAAALRAHLRGFQLDRVATVKDITRAMTHSQLFAWLTSLVVLMVVWWFRFPESLGVTVAIAVQAFLRLLIFSLALRLLGALDSVRELMEQPDMLPESEEQTAI